MKVFMTNGTYEFLRKLTQKYATINFHFMQGSNTLAYYEDYGKNIFATGREYTALQQSGEIEMDGYVAMDSFSVLREEISILEEHFRQQLTKLKTMPGFLAFRLLKPKKGNTYIAMSQWESERYYHNWINSDTFKVQQSAVKPPAFFADKPFTTIYTMIKE